MANSEACRSAGSRTPTSPTPRRSSPRPAGTRPRPTGACFSTSAPPMRCATTAASSRPPRRCPTARCAWISMVLVAGTHRRRGLATRLLHRCIADVTAAGLVPVLDATPAGAKVYAPLGIQGRVGICAPGSHGATRCRWPRLSTVDPIDRRYAGPRCAPTMRRLRQRPQRDACAPAWPPAASRTHRAPRGPHRGHAARARRPHRLASRTADRRG